MKFYPTALGFLWLATIDPRQRRKARYRGSILLAFFAFGSSIGWACGGTAVIDPGSQNSGTTTSSGQGGSSGGALVASLSDADVQIDIEGTAFMTVRATLTLDNSNGNSSRLVDVTLARIVLSDGDLFQTEEAPDPAPAISVAAGEKIEVPYSNQYDLGLGSMVENFCFNGGAAADVTLELQVSEQSDSSVETTASEVACSCC